MFNKIRGFLQWFLGGTFALVLAACYGPSIVQSVSGKVKVTDGSTNGIPGLQVDVFTPAYVDSTGITVSSYDDTNTNLTDTNGEVSVIIPNGVSAIQLTIRDIDGSSKGGIFQATNIGISNLTPEPVVVLKLSN
jgi:hypothetical protein